MQMVVLEVNPSWLLSTHHRMFHLSPPARNTDALNFFTSALLNCLDQPTRFCGFAPGPFESYSANHAVFSRPGSRQLSQPSLLMCGPNQLSINTTRANGRHGRPR